MKLTTKQIKVPLLGHGLAVLGNIIEEPLVMGYLSADTVPGTDGEEYALFTIADDGTQPAGWAGTYRINLQRLLLKTTDSNGNCELIERTENGNASTIEL